MNGAFTITGTVVTHDTNVLGTADDIDDFFNDGFDLDAGPQDEIELSGITVYLYSAAGRFLGTKTTDALGNYSFSGLPSDSYRVIIGTSTLVLLNSSFTTTAAVSLVNASSGTSVIQTLTTISSNISNIDFAFISNVDYDYGDLPLVYGMTTLNQDGAGHIIPGGGATVYLGVAPDMDINGVPTSKANGDNVLGTNDETGITPISLASWINGVNGGSIQANVTGSGWLVGWIDWNHDGDFLDSGELVPNRAVSTGTITVSFTIPGTTIGATSVSWLSRFRIFTTEPDYPLFSYTGVATNGEVEDYLIEKPVGASIGDLVWNDANNNGVFDASEDENSTGGTGNYLFTSVASGNYTVVEINPANSISTADVVGLNDDRIALVMTGSNVTGRDFLDTLPPVYAISGTVYDDADATNDNVIGAGDTPLASVTVKLFFDRDTNGVVNAGDSELSSVITNGSGAYSFTGVPAGNYIVEETDPAAATSNWDAQGILTDNQIAVAHISANITNRDFLDDGYLGSLGNLVWSDTNQNGLVDSGEPGLPGIPVRLYTSTQTPGVDAPIATTVTNASGIYGFANVVPGNYKIYLPTPPATLPGLSSIKNTGDNQINNDNNGSQSVLGGPVTSPVISISAGESDSTIDFACRGTFEEWQLLNPLGGQNQPAGNPDGDQFDNFIEFAFNQPAASGAGDPWCIRPSTTAPGSIEAVFTRPEGATENITYSLQYASILGGTTTWTSLAITPAMITLVDLGNCIESVTINDLETLTGLTIGKGFVRIRAVLATTVNHTSFTEVEGWTETNLGICCRTYNNPYLRCAEFTGTVDGVSGQTLTFTASAGAVDLATLLAAGASH